MGTMAEDNARDMERLRKVRDAKEALRKARSGYTISPSKEAALDAAAKVLEEEANYIEAVWN